jgi:hypothetical protein
LLGSSLVARRYRQQRYAGSPGCERGKHGEQKQIYRDADRIAGRPLFGGGADLVCMWFRRGRKRGEHCGDDLADGGHWEQ